MSFSLIPVAALLSSKRQAVLQAALNAAKTIKDEQSRSQALTAVAAQIPASETELLKEALDAVNKIAPGQFRSQALAAIAAQIPASELELLKEALDAAKNIGDEKFRFSALAAVAAQIPASGPKLLKEALDAAKNIGNEHFRFSALAAVAAQIPASELELLKEALEAAKNIKKDERSRWQAIAAVAAQIPVSEPELLKEAIDAANRIKNEKYRSLALDAVFAQLPVSGRQSVLQAALQAAKSIKDEQSRLQALAAVAALSTSEPELLKEALSVVPRIADDLPRWLTLAAVTAQIPAGEPELLKEALEAAKTIKGEEYRSQALAAVANQISASESELLKKVREAANNIGDERFRSQALVVVVAQLLTGETPLLKEATEVAETIEDEQSRSQALVAVVTHLPVNERRSLLQAALEATKAIKDGRFRSHILAAVVAQLPTGETPLLKEAIKIAKTTGDGQFRSQALAAIAAQLPADERQSVFKEALNAATSTDEIYRYKALDTVAVQLPVGESQLLKEVLDAANHIGYEKGRSQALAAVAAQIPASEPQLLKEALDAANSIESEGYRTNTLASVAAQLPASEPQLFKDALNAANGIEHEDFRSTVLTAVAAQLPAIEPQQLIQSVLVLERQGDRITILREIAFRNTEALLLHAPPTLLTTFLRIIPEGETAADRAKLLSALAPKLSPGLFPRALELIQTYITHPVYQAETLGNLAPYLPTDLLSEALDLIHQHVPGYSYPTTALCALIPYLPLAQLQTALRTAFIRIGRIRHIPIQSPELVNQILEAAATKVSNATRSQSKSEDSALKNRLVKHLLQRVQRYITDEKSITRTISVLAPSLSSDHLEIILEKILPKLQSDFYRAQILAALAASPRLTPKQLGFFRKTAETLHQASLKATALSALIPHFPELHSVVAQMIQAQPPNSYLVTELTLILSTRPHPKGNDSNGLIQLIADQTKALRRIRDQSRESDQADSLAKLTPHLRQDLWLEAQSVAQEIQSPYHQARSLLTLATHFPDVRAVALTQIANLQAQDPIQHIELLSQYTITVPEHIPTLLKTIENWANQTPFKDNPKEPDPNTFKRRRILIALKPHLPLRLGREIERETGIGKAPQSLWERALFLLRTGYRQALKSGTLRNDAAQDSDLLNLKEEINALTEMLLMRDLEPPVAVGILGGWGGGKSYIMHLMQTHMVKIRSQGMEPIEAWGLKEGRSTPDNDQVGRFVGHIYQIKFDAWTYAKADLWASLMQTIFFELDRQITLEQRLAQVLADDPEKPEDRAKVFYDKGDYWSVLYNANDADRDYFLERTLPQSKFQNFQDTQIGSVLWDEFLWKEYGKVRDRDEQQLVDQKQHQTTKEKEKAEQQEKLDELKNAIENNKEQQAQRIQTLEEEATSVTQAIDASLRISEIILIQRLGVPVFKAIQNQVEAELHQQNIKTDDIKKLHDSAREVVTKILATGKVQEALKEQSGKIQPGKIFNLGRQAGKQWFIRNIWLISGFGVLSLTAVAVPIILANLSVGAQIAGLIVPLVPAIGIAQKLTISSQKWYGQIVTVLSEYGEQVNDFQQNQQAESQKTLEKRLRNDKQLVELAGEAADLEKQKQNLDASIVALEQELEGLNKAISSTEKIVPKDAYGSLSSFVRSRTEDKSYDQHLGLMHQIKSDLWQLSGSLLPPANASELGVKLDKLKKVFPRGPARVVIYIDDLDRCPPNTVVKVLEAVQILVKSPLFIAVLAIDERYINRALAKHYKDVLSLRGRPSAADYLEKIIQIPYRIRPIDETALRNYLRAQVVVQDSETSGTKFNEFSPQEFNLLVQCCQESELSPRSLKRLTNVYKLYKVLSRTRGHRPTRREQKAILALLAFSSRYPDLMRDIIEEIGSHYEEGRHLLGQNDETETLAKIINTYLDKYERLSPNDALIPDVKKLRHDVEKLVEKDLKLKEVRQLFDFVRSFSFVGDIGMDYTPSSTFSQSTANSGESV